MLRSVSARSPQRPRVGIFGVLAAGNLGNDGSMQAVLQQVRTAHPEARLDAMGVDRERLATEYGLPSVPLHRLRRRVRTGGWRGRLLTLMHVAAGAAVDGWTTARWVAGHDVVIVPGMGTLESSLPIRPWQMPWSTFVMVAVARALGVTTAFVATGATRVGDPTSRWLLGQAARLASHRSFRDEPSRSRIGELGVDVSADLVVPDLVFALPTPSRAAPESGLVGVGVMEWWGSSEDRYRAHELHDRYDRELRRFLNRLLDRGHRVRLLTSDHDDHSMAYRLVEDLRRDLPTLGPGDLVYEPAHDVDELMAQVATTEVVVGSRFHIVLGGLKCARPTVAIGYSSKHAALMEQFGVPELNLPAYDFDADRAAEYFDSALARREALQRHLAARSAETSSRARDALAGLLDELLLDGSSQLADEGEPA